MRMHMCMHIGSASPPGSPSTRRVGICICVCTCVCILGVRIAAGQPIHQARPARVRTRADMYMSMYMHMSVCVCVGTVCGFNAGLFDQRWSDDWRCAITMNHAFHNPTCSTPRTRMLGTGDDQYLIRQESIVPLIVHTDQAGEFLGWRLAFVAT